MDIVKEGDRVAQLVLERVSCFVGSINWEKTIVLMNNLRSIPPRSLSSKNWRRVSVVLAALAALAFKSYIGIYESENIQLHILGGRLIGVHLDFEYPVKNLMNYASRTK